MQKRLAVLIAVTILPAVVAVAPAQTRQAYTHTPLVGMRSWFSSRFALRAPLSTSAPLSTPAPLSASFASIEPGAPPSVPVGVNPSGLAVNAATHTVYVVNQADDTVSVIDARRCSARHPSRCGDALATIRLGPGPLVNGPVSAVVSPDGGTLYVTERAEANGVAVIDARTCNATDTSGCVAGPVASVATGHVPLALAEDPTSGTLYVANIADNTVSLIDAARCNADQTAGCAERTPTVPVGSAPVAVAVDPHTHTVYVANVGDNTVSVIDAQRCNAKQSVACAQTPPVQAVGGAPDAITVSKRTDTVYVANSGNGTAGLVPDGNTVSVINAATCNGEHPQGCTAAPAPVVAVGGGQDNQPESLAVNQRTQNIYVANSSDDTLSVIDGKRCNARHVSGCAQPAPTVQTGAEPNALAVLPSAHTIYVSDAVDNAVAVIDDNACTARHPAGCRPAPVPAAPLAPYHQLVLAAVDVAQHTVYVSNAGVNFAGPATLDLIDTNKCNAGDTSGCNPHPPLPTVPLASAPGQVTVDPSTDTLYLSVGGNDGELEVIDAATCNATITSCANAAKVPLGTNNGGGPIAIDSATHTLYVGGVADIRVIDTRHCNAADLSGCATQTPPTIPVDPSPNAFAGARDTLYDAEFPSTGPGFVDVIDTRHCRAGDTSRCAAPHRSYVTVGVGPSDAALDLADHTLYVPDNGNGIAPGLLSMIDITHCNGDDTSDCASQTPRTTPMRRTPLGATLDPFTGMLYVANHSNASVSLIDTASCNATILSGCPPVPPAVTVGSGPFYPSYTALDPIHHTIYVPNSDGTVSLVRTGH